MSTEKSFSGGLSKIFMSAVNVIKGGLEMVSGCAGLVTAGLSSLTGQFETAGQITKPSVGLLGQGAKQTFWDSVVNLAKGSYETAASFIPPSNSSVEVGYTPT